MTTHTVNGHDALLAGERPDLSRHLTRQLLALIGTRNLQPGDRLPSIRELAERFAVATPTIREAVRRLEATGVVDIRHGSGVYVRKVPRGLVITNPHLDAIDAGSVLELLEARLAIEPHLAGRAADLATPADLAALREILAAAELLLEGDDARLSPTNMRFHHRIARISGNTILVAFLESLGEIYAREQLGIIEIFNARVEDHRDHVAIFEAIRDHDPARATATMTHHLHNVREVVARRLLGEGA